MSQGDVLELLKKKKGWMITGEIMSELEVSRVQVNRALRCLFKEGIVMRKEVPIRRGGRQRYLWKYKD